MTFLSRLGIVLALATVTAYAAPSIHGPTGLITVPTAEALQPKELGIGVDFLSSNHTDSKVNEHYYKANFSNIKNWEIGVVGGKVPTEGVFVNIKYYLSTDGERFPLNLAIGVQNMFSSEKTDIYMVASKRLPNNLALHLGFKANFGKTELYPSFMAGLEYFLSNHVSVISDVNGEKKVYEVGLGLRVMLTDTLLLHLLAVDVTKATPKGTEYGIGLSYTSAL
jgi:hypothetical protein